MSSLIKILLLTKYKVDQNKFGFQDDVAGIFKAQTHLFGHETDGLLRIF